jgi:hypothetical protein
MKNYNDSIYGGVAAVATWVVSHWSGILSGLIGLSSLILLLLKIRREWIYRNQKPDDK